MASIIFTRRFFVLVVMVVAINACWQLLRVWLPKFLQQGRGYSENEALFFNSAYFSAFDVGCIAAGAATVMLHRRGLAVHGSRSFDLGMALAGCAPVLAWLVMLVFWTGRSDQIAT